VSDSQSLALSIDARKAQQGADEFRRAADKVIGDSGKIEAATLKQVESMGRQARSLDALSRRYDPLSQAVRDATRDYDRLNTIVQRGGDNAARAASLMAAAQARITAAQQAQTAGMRQAETASRSLATQTAETGSVFQSLAGRLAGVNPLVVAGAAAATGMAVAMKSIATTGDAANAAIARLSATVGSSEQGASIFEALTASSRQTGIAVTDSASAFQRFSIAAKDVGATSDQVLKLVDGLQKFAIVSGSSMQETAAATQQLGQALASGVLQGDELRSILENMPMFAQALARELGTSVGNLRTMGAEGKLTADTIFPAMMRAAQGVDDVFAGMPVTMARAQSQFDVAAQSFLTHLDKAIGFSNRLADALRVAASIVDKIRNFTGGSTGAERTAELIAGQTGIQKRIEEWKLALADARASQLPDSDQQVQAILKGMDASKAALQKNRDELLQINNEAVRRDEAAQEAASEGRLAAEVVSHTKSVDELRKKYDKDFTIRKEYDEGVKKLEAARNSGAVSEADYLKISTAMLKERDEALAKLTKTEDTHKAGVKATTKAVEEQVSAYQKSMDSLNKQIEETDEATKSQARVTAAYDGTEASLERVQAQEKAYLTAFKAGIKPGMEDHEKTVSRLSESYLASADAAREFQHIQSSVQAITDILSTAFDRLGQGIVDAFLSGKGAAVSFSNIVKSVMGSVATSLVQLGAVNPILNSFGGKQRDSLWSGLGVMTGGNTATGGGGLSSLFGAASNASTFGGITDALGLTDIAGKLSSFGEYLGLTGTNGAFSGIGSGISSFLSTGINGVGLSTATNTALSGLGAGVYGPAAPSSVLAAQGGATIGGMLSGVGLGFGAGSLAGGLLQSSLGKVGPAPTIGAGAGAVGGALAGTFIFPGVGTVLGGLLGGLLGGGGGGLIGPKAATPFSATGLNKDASGMLSVGQTFSQIVDVTAEVNALQQQVSALNSLLSGSGTRIANAVSADNYGQARLIGGNSGQWLNFGQGDGRPGDLNAAFGELRFGSDNQYLNRGLEGQSFGTAEALQTAVTDILNFVDVTAPALKALIDVTPSFGAGTLATTIDTLSRQFDDAKVMADRLGFAEYDLTEARAKAIQIANDNAAKQLEDSRKGLLARFTAARGVNSGNLQMQLDAQLLVFDTQAAAQREAFGNNLKSVFGDAYAETQAFTEQMAFLEATLGEERLSTAKSYLDQINAAQAQASAQAAQAAAQAAAQTERAASTAAGIVRNITDYVQGIKFGGESPLSSGERYMAASEQFNRTVSAARSGDGNALSNLTRVAETFRTASRAQFGSGAQSVRDFDRIVSALEGVATMPAESLTSAIFTNETRTQTQTLVMELRDLKAELSRLRDDVRRTASAPSSARAA
jgi:tape measure domain-containing protein